MFGSTWRDIKHNEYEITKEANELPDNIADVTGAFYKKRNYKKLKAKYTLEYKPLYEADILELEDLVSLAGI